MIALAIAPRRALVSLLAANRLARQTAVVTFFREWALW
jgi:hypothetical protein